MQTIEASSSVITVSNRSDRATKKERADAGESLLEATHRINQAGRDLSCALVGLCRFPMPDWSNHYDWDEAVEYAMAVETGSPEFMELRRFVKEQQVVLDGLYDRITQLAESHELPLEWVKGRP